MSVAGPGGSGPSRRSRRAAPPRAHDTSALRPRTPPLRPAPFRFDCGRPGDGEVRFELLELLLAEALHLDELLDPLERRLLAVLEDPLHRRLAHPRKLVELRGGGGVEVHHAADCLLRP